MQASGHNSDLGRWDVAFRDADPRLAPYVSGFFASSGYLPKPVRERHLPSPEVPLLINFATPHSRGDSGGGWTRFDGSWIVGLHDTHQLSEASGAREFLIARFTPLGAHLFLGVPMDAIANRAVALSDLDKGLAQTIAARVGRARGWSARFAAMEALIGARVADADVPDATSLAWRALVAADGRITLGALAAKMDCSHRTMIAQFRAHVGLTPKTAARLLRFDRAVRALNAASRRRSGAPGGKPFIEIAGKGVRAANIAWADVATDCGYFDQPHFIREFRQFAGATPAEFLRTTADIG